MGVVSVQEALAQEARMMGRPCTLRNAHSIVLSRPELDVLTIVYDVEPGDGHLGTRIAQTRFAVFANGQQQTSGILHSETLR